MKRRKLITGIGAATIGSSLTLGTGAFTAAQLGGRSVDIAVVNDADALVGLVPNPEVGSVEIENGELAIDLDDPGINEDSVYQFGYFVDDAEFEEYDVYDSFLQFDNEPAVDDEDGCTSAFLVANQAETTKPIQLELEVNESETDDSVTFVFQTHQDGSQIDTIQHPGETTATAAELSPGGAFGVSFFIQTTDAEVGDRVSVTLRVSAGKVVDQELLD